MCIDSSFAALGTARRTLVGAIITLRMSVLSCCQKAMRPSLSVTPRCLVCWSVRREWIELGARVGVPSVVPRLFVKRNSPVNNSSQWNGRRWFLMMPCLMCIGNVRNCVACLGLWEDGIHVARIEIWLFIWEADLRTKASCGSSCHSCVDPFM